MANTSLIPNYTTQKSVMETARDIQGKLILAPGFNGHILKDDNNHPFGVVVEAKVEGRWMTFRREIDVAHAQKQMLNLHEQGLMSSISAKALGNIEKVRRIVMRQLLDWVTNGISDTLLGTSSGPIETFGGYLTDGNGLPAFRALENHIKALPEGQDEHERIQP